MPVFAFTVGSLGDFLALGELIVKLGVALYKPGEATKDYEDLRRELELLCRALGKIEVCKGQRRSMIADGCLKAVQDQAAACEKIIRDFLDNRKEPTRSVWSKISWSVKGPNEAAELRQRLSAHRETMSLLLEILLSQQLSEVMAMYETGVKDMQSIVQQRPMQVTLVDAVGNYRYIPFDFCFTYEMFSDVLRAYYKHQKLPGLEWVERGDYQVVSGDNHQIVPPSRWKSTVKPNSTVEMSMILRRLIERGSECPRCGKVFHGKTINGWDNCISCDAQFRHIYEAAETNEIVSPGTAAAPEQQMVTGENNGNTPGVIIKMASLREEWKAFRLLSVVELRHVPSPQDSIDEQKYNQIKDQLIIRVENDSSNANDWYLLGRAYMGSHKYNMAYEALQQAVYRNGRDPLMWNSIAILYFTINQFKDSLDALSHAIRLNSFLSEIWWNLAVLYETTTSQLKDALDAYRRAKELAPMEATFSKRFEDVEKHLVDPSFSLVPIPPMREVYPMSHYNL